MKTATLIKLSPITVFIACALCSALTPAYSADTADARPNILFVLSDDHSWPHASAYGSRFVDTPAFDRVASEGILFNRSFSAAPGCSPSRAAVLTGRNIWQIEEAAAHASLFPAKLPVYPDLLADAGYHVGYTGKGWGPGDWKAGGRTHNPAGPVYNEQRLENPISTGIAQHSDYLWNFDDFLAKRSDGSPFCFWVGVREPHRPYEAGTGLRAGKNPDDVVIPAFLPDRPEVRADFLDYAYEIEHFDAILAGLMKKLEAIGELDNTLIVVTGDNGMPFPRAKSDLYEYGIHMPMAIRWGDRVKPGRHVDDFISFIDLAPTFLEAAGMTPPDVMTGRSMLAILLSKKSGQIDKTRDRVFSGKERHSHQRHDNLGYPSRVIRTDKYLYIRNFKPDRWPSGDAYADLDKTKHKPGSTTSSYMRFHKDDPEIRGLLDRASAKRGAEELFLVEEDPACMNDLAYDPAYEKVRAKLSAELNAVLTEQGDPRVLGYGDIFDSYPRFMSMNQNLPGFKQRDIYNPEYVRKAQDALVRIEQEKSRR